MSSAPLGAPHRPPQEPWPQHLVAQASCLLTGEGQRPVVHAPPLSEREAQRLERYRDRLLAALQARDRAALTAAKQEVVRAAFAPCAGEHPLRSPPSPALRQALRELVWRMSGLLLPRAQRHG
ncbi:MAG: hypothetical protein ACK5OA_14105 [Acidovorax sp.]